MLGVRLDPETERQLEAAARRSGRSKSDVVRDAIRRYLTEDAFLAEARRQSLAASARDDDAEAAELALSLVDAGVGE